MRRSARGARQDNLRRAAKSSTAKDLPTKELNNGHSVDNPVPGVRLQCRGRPHILRLVLRHFPHPPQINYAGLADLMTGGAEKAGRVMAAMMTMKKVDVQALIDAAG